MNTADRFLVRKLAICRFDWIMKTLTLLTLMFFWEFHWFSDVMLMLLFEPDHTKTCLMPYATNKGADQPVHPRSLISTFVVRCLV